MLYVNPHPLHYHFKVRNERSHFFLKNQFTDFFFSPTKKGVYLNDFTIIDEVPSKLQNGMINFDKMRTISNMFQQIQKFQQAPFVFRRVSCIEEFWARTLILDEKELYSAAEKVKNQVGLNPSEFLSFHRSHTAPKVRTRRQRRNESPLRERGVRTLRQSLFSRKDSDFSKSEEDKKKTV